MIDTSAIAPIAIIAMQEGLHRVLSSLLSGSRLAGICEVGLVGDADEAAELAETEGMGTDGVVSKCIREMRRFRLVYVQ